MDPAVVASRNASYYLAFTLNIMQNITIYHNPRCGTSREVLQIVRDHGIEPTIIEYLKNPPSRQTLVGMIAQAGLTVREAVRAKEPIYDTLGLADDEVGDDELLDAMIDNPILINRPFVVTELGTRLCRPAANVLALLPETAV
jgi:arsenate reductase